MNLSELKTHTPHPLKPVFQNYALGQIANKLGIGASYLSNILSGFAKPGKKLMVKIENLADEILKAEHLEG